MNRLLPVVLCFLFVGCSSSDPTDLTPRDAGVARDGGPPRDAGPGRDAGFYDGGFRDAGFRDGGVPVDAGFRDGGFADAGFVDAGFPDAGFRDGGPPPDSGPSCMDGIRNEDEIWIDCGGWCNNECPPCPGTGNLIRNASFENATMPVGGQGVLPDDWIIVSGSPDIYSDNGSFGLAPSSYGNFTGVTAYDGHNWAAGWNGAQEDFGQVLTSTLTPGVRYRLEAVLHRAVRNDISDHGGYDVRVAADVTRAGALTLGALAATSSAGWEPRRFEFVAPSGVDTRPLMVFEPVAPGASTYPGLDDLSLVQTTSCAP